MSHREKLELVLDHLPPERIGEILNFAEFLSNVLDRRISRARTALTSRNTPLQT